MKNAIVRLFLENQNLPFEVQVEDFIFEYGLGKEKWGSKELVLQYAFKTHDNDSIKKFKNFILKLAPYLQDIKDLQKIQIEIIDKDDFNNSQIFSYEKNEFSNFNIMYVIDNNPRLMMAFEAVI